VIRVWVETSSAVARAGFKSLLASDETVEIVNSPAGADVILRDELPIAPEMPGTVPIVVMTDGPVSPRALQGGVRAILYREASPEQIAGALHAVSAGLFALPAEYTSLLIHAAASEAEVEALTPRETDVLEMLAEGFSNKQIAAGLNISEHTAKFHVNSILSKLQAGTRTEAVIRGIRAGLIKV
jgi:DNA-binding NarL/FixJ family response regulator